MWAAISPLASDAQTKKGSKAGKSKKPAKGAAATQEPSSTEDATPKYYRLAGLGSTEGDSVKAFPYPTVILQPLDTVHTRIVVRFPGLGMLGIQEDTVTQRSFIVEDSLSGYQPADPLILLTFPKTPYLILVDVWSKDSNKLIESRALPYDMNVSAYKTAALNYIHEPTTDLANPTLRRRFQPTLLPFSVETNPGWRANETLDSNMVYALVFRDPGDPLKLEMSITMRPALVGKVDSSMWENFKDKARLAFGSKGVVVNSIGDFQVEDVPTRRYIRSGYEFVAKGKEGELDYVAAFLTPRAILMMLAPLDPAQEQVQYAYFRAIARSLKID